MKNTEIDDVPSSRTHYDMTLTFFLMKKMMIFYYIVLSMMIIGCHNIAHYILLSIKIACTLCLGMNDIISLNVNFALSY